MAEPNSRSTICSAAICAILPQGEAPKSILLIPAGRFSPRDARKPWANSDPEAVIAASDALQMTAGLPIDYDHATDLAAPKGMPAPAAGWIKKLRVQDGAIWGDVEWTEAGAKAVASGAWRYISPVFDYSKKDRIVTRLLRAALTNNPALYDTAIAAREGKQEEDDMEHDEFKAKLAALHGLGEDASHEEILKACQAAKAAAEDDDEDEGEDTDQAAARLIASGKVVSQEKFTSLLTEVNQLKADRRRETAAVKVDAAIREFKLTPAQRDWAISYCAADEKAFDEFIAKQPALKLGADGRFEHRNPGEQGAVLSKDEERICAAFGMKSEEYGKQKTALAASKSKGFGGDRPERN